MKNGILLLSIVALVCTACLKDKTVEPVPVGPCSETVFFENEILGEIINVSCNVAGCHDSGGASGGHVWETHEQISANAPLMLKAMSHESPAVPMPFEGDKLADSLIQKFDCWIQQGMPNN